MSIPSARRRNPWAGNSAPWSGAISKAESFDYGPGRIPEEHIFVPKPGGRREDDGWLIGTVLDWRKGVSGLSLFDARAVAAGPVAQAWLPYPLPLGFHGAFVRG